MYRLSHYLVSLYKFSGHGTEYAFRYVVAIMSLTSKFLFEQIKNRFNFYH